MVGVGGIERECVVLDFVGPSVVVKFTTLDCGISVSLNNGRFRGAKLQRNWVMHPDDLAVARAYARHLGQKIKPCGVGSYLPRPKKAKPADPRQANLVDNDSIKE